MPNLNARLAGFELYCDDLPGAKQFYEKILGLNLSSERPGHHAQFDLGSAFLCLEKKGVEEYPSKDKAVIFLEVASVQAAVDAVGRTKVVHYETSSQSWAVLHDPEGHNILLIEKRK